MNTSSKKSTYPNGSKKVEKFIVEQGRTLSFYDKSNRRTYTVTRILSEALRSHTKCQFLMRSKLWGDPVTEYVNSVEDLANIMFEVSGDMRKWHVGSKWVNEAYNTGI